MVGDGEFLVFICLCLDNVWGRGGCGRGRGGLNWGGVGRRRGGVRMVEDSNDWKYLDEGLFGELGFCDVVVVVLKVWMFVVVEVVKDDDV